MAIFCLIVLKQNCSVLLFCRSGSSEVLQIELPISVGGTSLSRYELHQEQEGSPTGTLVVRQCLF